MDYLIGVLFVAFMLLVDWRLNKIYQQLVQITQLLARPAK